MSIFDKSCLYTVYLLFVIVAGGLLNQSINPDAVKVAIVPFFVARFLVAGIFWIVCYLFLTAKAFIAR